MYKKRDNRLYLLITAIAFLCSSCNSNCLNIIFGKKEPVKVSAAYKYLDIPKNVIKGSIPVVYKYFDISKIFIKDGMPIVYKYLDISKEFVVNNKGLSVLVPVGILVPAYCAKKLLFAKKKPEIKQKQKRSLLGRLLAFFFRPQNETPQKQIEKKEKKETKDQEVQVQVVKKVETKKSKDTAQDAKRPLVIPEEKKVRVANWGRGSGLEKKKRRVPNWGQESGVEKKKKRVGQVLKVENPKTDEEKEKKYKKDPLFNKDLSGFFVEKPEKQEERERMERALWGDQWGNRWDEQNQIKTQDPKKKYATVLDKLEDDNFDPEDILRALEVRN